MDALDTFIAFSESEQFVPYTMSALAIGVFGSLFAAALAIYFFCRKSELPAGLNWRSDVALACRALRFVLIQDKVWTLTLVGWSVVWTTVPDFVNEGVGWVFFYSAWLITSFCCIRLAWAVNRMIVVMKSPEEVPNYVPFGSSWMRLNLINLLWSIPAVVGAFLFGFPGVLYCLFTSLSQASCSVSNNGIFASLKDSFRLIKNNFGSAAKYLIPTALLFGTVPTLLTIAVLIFDSFTTDYSLDVSVPREPMTIGISAILYMVQGVFEFVQFGVMSALCTLFYLSVRGQNSARASQK